MAHGGKRKGAGSGDTYIVLGATRIMGWGELDGPAYNISADGCAWEVSVPKRYWDYIQSKSTATSPSK